ncbi:MAG: AmmeMemoRadiSam system protein A [Nannocystaceae bacterium]
MSSPEPVYDRRQRARLLALARASLEFGVTHGRPIDVDPDAWEPALRVIRATFVTLREGGALRGCIGTLEASQPLCADVAERAFEAGFSDPRFPPIAAPELPGLTVSISVLSPATPIPCATEAALLAALRPGIDGLILRAGYRRGTFLPSVWEQLPTPRQFLDQLKRKAGIAPYEWPPTLEASRYTAESFSERALA